VVTLYNEASDPETAHRDMGSTDQNSAVMQREPAVVDLVRAVSHGLRIAGDSIGRGSEPAGDS
jgi:hypothetical protein